MRKKREGKAMSRTLNRKTMKKWRATNKTLLEKYSHAQLLAAFTPTTGERGESSDKKKKSSMVIKVSRAYRESPRYLSVHLIETAE